MLEFSTVEKGLANHASGSQIDLFFWRAGVPQAIIGLMESADASGCAAVVRLSAGPVDIPQAAAGSAMTAGSSLVCSGKCGLLIQLSLERGTRAVLDATNLADQRRDSLRGIVQCVLARLFRADAKASSALVHGRHMVVL